MHIRIYSIPVALYPVAPEFGLNLILNPCLTFYSVMIGKHQVLESSSMANLRLIFVNTRIIANTGETGIFTVE